MMKFNQLETIHRDSALQEGLQTNRREFLSKTGMSLGALAFASFFPSKSSASSQLSFQKTFPHFAPKVKRMIYLFQSGGPSQHDLFDYKPLLNKMDGEELPDSVRQGQRV